MDEAEVFAVHNAIHDGSNSVVVRGLSYPITVSTGGMRHCFPLGHKFMEQNKKKNSKYSELAKQGHKVTWCLSGGMNNWGCVVDDRIEKRCVVFLTAAQSEAQRTASLGTLPTGTGEFLQQQTGNPLSVPSQSGDSKRFATLDLADQTDGAPKRKRRRASHVNVTPKDLGPDMTLKTRFEAAYNDENVQQAMGKIQERIRLVQESSSLPLAGVNENSSSHPTFLHARRHAKIWASRPEGPDACENQRKLLSGVMYAWGDMVDEHISTHLDISVERGVRQVLTADLESLLNSNWHRQKVQDLLSLLLPLDRANALYFMKLRRSDSSCPRGIGWFSRDDGAPEGCRESHRQLTENPNALFPISETLRSLLRLFQLEDFFQVLMRPIFCRDGHFDSSHGIPIDEFGELDTSSGAVPLGNRFPQVSEGEVTILSHDDIVLGEILGRGAFGTVRKGMYFGTPVAVKELHGATASTRESFVKEALLLQQLRHPNIVTTLGIIQPPLHDAGGSFSLVLEFMSGGDLQDWIVREGPLDINPSFLPENTTPVDAIQQRFQQILELGLGIARGVNFLHNAKPPVIHRDLKPLNVLLSSRDGVSIVPKLADFGVSRSKSEGTAAMTRVGTPHFMCPELIKDEPYNEKADIFSLGMLFWAMMSAKTPFSHKLGEGANDKLYPVLLCIMSDERPPLVKLGIEDNGSDAHRTLSQSLNEFNALIESCWDPVSSARVSCNVVVETLTKLSEGKSADQGPRIPSESTMATLPTVEWSEDGTSVMSTAAESLPSTSTGLTGQVQGLGF